MIRPIPCAPVGSALIEVLVALLLFSLGMLAVGLMLAHTVQLPKLALYRATALHLAAGHIERMRANPKGDHRAALNYDGSFGLLVLADCAYPTCSSDALTAMDKAYTQKQARAQLPAGSLQVSCDDTPCVSGQLWLVWQEPGALAALSARPSDDCPAPLSTPAGTPAPRCLYVRFSL